MPDRPDPADRAALRDLVETYARACDRRDRDLLTTVWLPDSVLRVHRADGTVSTMEGTDRIGRITELLGRFPVTFHLVANHHVEVDGDGANGEVYSHSHHLEQVDGQTFDYAMFIRYDDRYARTGDGWRIAERDVRLLWTTRVPVVEAPALGTAQAPSRS